MRLGPTFHVKPDAVRAEGHFYFFTCRVCNGLQAHHAHEGYKELVFNYQAMSISARSTLALVFLETKKPARGRL